MKTINKTKAKQLIKESKGLIFAATFTKKDLSSRMMLARLGKKYTPTGKAAPYKAEDYNLLPAYDMKIKAFRMININTLTKLSINANKYLIK
tara:strand:- start:241 stop:516 length:276 start_codon:yes stop_codon:yes gene_type:complete